MKSDYVIERSEEELVGDKWEKEVIPGMDTQYVIEDARPRQSSSKLHFLLVTSLSSCGALFYYRRRFSIPVVFSSYFCCSENTSTEI